MDDLPHRTHLDRASFDYHARRHLTADNLGFSASEKTRCPDAHEALKLALCQPIPFPTSAAGLVSSRLLPPSARYRPRPLTAEELRNSWEGIIAERSHGEWRAVDIDVAVLLIDSLLQRQDEQKALKDEVSILRRDLATLSPIRVQR